MNIVLDIFKCSYLADVSTCELSCSHNVCEIGFFILIIS